MSKRTHQARAVVTGAGSGIGRSLALELARRGSDVVCADVNLSTAQATADLIEGIGQRALAVPCDVARRDDVESLRDSAAVFFDAIPSLIVNNAGVGVGGQPIGVQPAADWDWALGINLWGPIHGCHAFVPGLRELGYGGVINVASAAGFSAAPLMGAYNVSKAGVMALSETLRAELLGTGVGVTVLCPTFVRTNIVDAGRITPGASSLAAKAMRLTGRSADAVARQTLNAHDRGQLYVVPQIDARLIWRTKRLAPAPYALLAGLLGKAAPADHPHPSDVATSPTLKG